MAASHRLRLALAPALRDVGVECAILAGRLTLYGAALAVVAAVAWMTANGLRADAAQPVLRPATGWAAPLRASAAFAAQLPDLKSDDVETLRHPLGGRKDILRWRDAGGVLRAEVTLYRPGGETGSDLQVEEAGAGLERLGVIDTKLGPLTLERPAGERRCLGFRRAVEGLRLTGHICQGASLPAQRAAAACLVNRLVLLSAGGDERLAALFARAELAGARCLAAAGGAQPGADWIGGVADPSLRGRL